MHKNHLLLYRKSAATIAYVYGYWPMQAPAAGQPIDIGGETGIFTNPYWPQNGNPVLKDGAKVELHTQGSLCLVSIDISDMLYPEYYRAGYQGDMQLWVHYEVVAPDNAVNRLQASMRRKRFSEITGGQ